MRRPGSLLATSDHDMFSKCVEEPEPRAESPRPLVATWSLGLRQLLADPAGRAAFAAYLDKQFSRENLEFWLECEEYRRSGGAARARQIWERYLADDAPSSVNVDARSRAAASARLAEAPPDLFEQAQEHVFRLMNFDSYRRFLDSKEHASCARAELLGKANPYLPTAANSTPTKLKKSRSNVEEGRRLFISLLRPWESSASKEEEQAKKPHNIPLERLCRVVLPGQARTVVVADEKSVRHTIDNLLRHRAIRCTDYDVKVDGLSEPLNLDAPMSSLDKRVIVVEPRVSLRLQVADRRPLAVRSKPEKTLAEVIRSVFRDLKAEEVKVFRGKEPIPTSTKLQDLENERLTVQIVKKSEQTTEATPPIHPATRSFSTTVQPCYTNHGEESTNKNPVGGVTRSISTNQSEDSANRSAVGEIVRSISANQIEDSANKNAACSLRQAATLDEITNRVFDEVLSGKTQLPVLSVVNSVKSDCCSSDRSSRGSGGVAVVTTKIRDGDTLRVASVTPDPTKCKSSSTESSPDSKTPIPAVRRYTRPQPAARTSLAKTAVAQDARTSLAKPVVVQDVRPGTQDLPPPPLPPKPKYPPTKPPNWGHKPEEIPINRMVYLDQPTSSFV